MLLVSLCLLARKIRRKGNQNDQAFAADAEDPTPKKMIGDPKKVRGIMLNSCCEGTPTSVSESTDSTSVDPEPLPPAALPVAPELEPEHMQSNLRLQDAPPLFRLHIEIIADLDLDKREALGCDQRH